MDPFLINVLTLAYIGDATYELYVRRALVKQAALPAGQVHRMAMNYVSATNQSKACDVLIPLLSEDELSIFMRARNANSPHVPRNANLADYHKATALEAVFGYLELMERTDRMQELFNCIFDFLSKQKD